MIKKKHVLKVTVIIFLFINLCISFFSVMSKEITAQATENDRGLLMNSIDNSLDENVIEQLENLELKELEEYLRGMEGFAENGLADSLFLYLQGAKFNFSDFLQEIKTIFFDKILLLFPNFAVITAITLLTGVISTLKSGVNGKTTSEMIFLIAFAAALIPLLSVLIECFKQTANSISEMRKQMQIVYPIMLTLMAASGGAVSASVCRPAVAFFSTSIVSIMDGIILPLTVTIIVLSMAGNLSKEIKIGKFGAFFKSINKWIIGICVSVFGIFFTLQGITTAIYDGVVRRAAKYAIGNGVPIVGGFLSGGFDLAVAGSVLIKNSLGTMGIFMMLSVLIEPIVLLFSVNLLLRLISAITQPFGDSRISDFLGETAENLHYCSAGLLITAFLYFLTIVLMIYSTEALF